MKARVSSLAVLALTLLFPAAALPANGDAVVTSVFSNISNGYQRKKLPDGSFQKEFYALATGFYTPGSTENPSIDKSQFPQLSALVAKQLAKQNYFLAEDSKSAEILLVISWGTTIPYNDNGGRASMDQALGAMNRLDAAARHEAAGSQPQTRAENFTAENASMRVAAQSDLEGQMVELGMFNNARRKSDEYNAQLLGYVDEINNHDNASRFGGAGTYFDDLISDIEEERYYVIVTAYDFQSAVKEKKRKQLWATRISIRSQGNRFDQQLATMLATASGYFGQNSKQLVRQYQNGTVHIGDMKVVGVEPEATTPAKSPEEK